MKKFRENWEVEQYVAMGTLTGLVAPRVKRNMDITVCVNGHEGWFEMYDEESSGEDFYASGGLRFRNDKLVGFDGVSSLPDEILNKLEEHGYGLDDI